MASLPPEPPTDPPTDPVSGRVLGAARGELFVRSGPAAGLRFALHDGVVTVGRSSQSDCRLRDEAVSRRHFELAVTPERRAACSTWGAAMARASTAGGWNARCCGPVIALS